jgi:SlyX protein
MSPRSKAPSSRRTPDLRRCSTLPPLAGNISGMADEHSRRADKLEANLAHLEHQVEQLNGVVIEQGRLLERLKKEVQRQSSAMQTMELDRIKSNNTKPPHYQ